MANEFAQSPRTATPPKPPLSTQYPKMFYHPSGRAVTVRDAEEESKLDKRTWGPRPHPVFTDEPSMPGDACKQCANMRAKFDHAYRQVASDNARLSNEIAALSQRNSELQYDVGQLTAANRAYAEKEKEAAFGERLVLPSGEFEGGPLDDNFEATPVEDLLEQVTAQASHKKKKG